MKHFIPFLFIVLSQSVCSQNIFNSGDRTFYDTLSTTYTKFDIKGTNITFEEKDLSNGKKTSSGYVSTFYFGVGERIKDPIIFQGSYTTYAQQSFWGTKAGDRTTYLRYNFRGNNLDGIHKIGALQHYWDYSERQDRQRWIDDRDYFVAIAGNVVDSRSYPTSGKYKEDLMSKVEGIELKMADWLSSGFNVDWFHLPPFPLPTIHNEDELYYDLDQMVEIFLDDFRGYLMDFKVHQAIWQRDDEEYSRFEILAADILDRLNLIQTTATFENLDGSTLALSYGINNEEQIIIKVDPDNWLKSDAPNKWYILYHELGHDVFNFKHGQGGRMMFNYPTKNYTWDEFFKDRDAMFLKAILNEYPVASKSEMLLPSW